MVWNIGNPGAWSFWSLGIWVKGTVLLSLSLLRCLLFCLFWTGWSLHGLWPKLAVLRVHDLPVVKIMHLLIFL